MPKKKKVFVPGYFRKRPGKKSGPKSIKVRPHYQIRKKKK